MHKTKQNIKPLQNCTGFIFWTFHLKHFKNIDYTISVLICKGTRPRGAVGNLSGCRYVSDCRSRGREILIQEGLSVTSGKYVLEVLVNCLVKLARKKCG